jgi:cytochrome P450
VFVFNFAGHDTTANTLTFALAYLATHPAIQDWLYAELNHVFGTRAIHDWDYTTDFPRLKRCLAVMLETIRLRTPVPVGKWTGDSSQRLTIRGKVITIPPKTMVIPSYAAVHTHPRFWGEDAGEWRPGRWIIPGQSTPDPAGDTPASAPDATPFDEVTLLDPRRGTYIPWSEGERSCPGKKFSQVEFVATMAALFRAWRVAPVRRRGESVDEARRRIMDLVEKDSAQVLLLQMLHPERAVVSWKRREGESDG